jgi:hypothetical protein
MKDKSQIGGERCIVCHVSVGLGPGALLDACSEDECTYDGHSISVMHIHLTSFSYVMAAALEAKFGSEIRTTALSSSGQPRWRQGDKIIDGYYCWSFGTPDHSCEPANFDSPQIFLIYRLDCARGKSEAFSQVICVT